MSNTQKRTARRAIAVAALATIGSVAAAASPASAEAFHTSKMTKSFIPWASPTSRGVNVWTIPSGTSVSMKCWTTGANVDGTAKWFRVQSNAYPFTSGYVPANDVGNQWLSSPHC